MSDLTAWARSLEYCGPVYTDELGTAPYQGVQIIRPGFLWNRCPDSADGDMCWVYRLTLGPIAICYPGRRLFRPRDIDITRWVESTYAIELVHDRRYPQLEGQCPAAFCNSYACWFEATVAESIAAPLFRCRLCHERRPHTGENLLHPKRKQPCDECRKRIRERVDHQREGAAIKRSKSLLKLVRTVSSGRTPDQETIECAKSPKQRQREAEQAMKRVHLPSDR